jgi:radical SAM protein with 4Fe4S-binding SPASM domain
VIERFFSRAPKPRRFRPESFGGIIQLTRPRALVFVDHAVARWLGGNRDGSTSMDLGDEVLSAPLEAHLQLTNQCSAGCRGCYTGATPNSQGEWGPKEWCDAIDTLADMGVFHLALGGGESADLPWLGDIAKHARRRGLIPNLTTSGLSNVDRLVGIAHLFGQINVSIDGLGETYAKVRGFDGFAAADAALVELRKVHRQVGINTVITRHNFDELDALFRYARRRRVREIELLRYKPSGRALHRYESHRCTDDQHRRLLPVLRSAALRHRLRIRVDCSYTPMLAYHRPSPELLAGLAVYGCVGGDFLVGAKADGTVSACSFAGAESSDVAALDENWTAPDMFGKFRAWRDAAEPCSSCAYLKLCRGGCRAVSGPVKGDMSAPDPECPRVVDHFRGRSGRRNRHHLPVCG